MKVINTRKPTMKSFAGPLFTGPNVTLQTLLPESKEFDVNVVNFGKGVRNIFHTHDCEQVLIITAGKGFVATGKKKVAVAPGDVVLFPAGEKHWHGAAKGSTFSHIYIYRRGTKCTIVK